jgi:hypothetical protein
VSSAALKRTTFDLWPLCAGQGGKTELSLHAGKKTKAYHEAGHAVIARVLGIDVEYASLFPTDTDDATVAYDCALYLARNKEIVGEIAAAENDVKVMLAGALAQERHEPLSEGQRHKAIREGGGWHDDWNSAAWLVTHILYFLRRGGLSDLQKEPDPEGVLAALGTSDEFDTVFDRLWEETRVLVYDNWAAIERVAAALLERRYLHEDDIDALIAATPAE